MGVREDRAFFQGLVCEPLTANEVNRKLLANFSSRKIANSLEKYLTDENYAWRDDLNGHTRVYVIKDGDDIVCYFSIRCGLLIGTGEEEGLSETERQLVDSYVTARVKNDEETMEAIYTFMLDDNAAKADRIVEIALNRIERKNDPIEIDQSKQTLNVSECYSAIELMHLCKNENYASTVGDVPVGFGCFWEIIVPIVVDLSKKIGCRFLYLFAANVENPYADNKERKLINYYKNNMKFHECDEGIRLIKPTYDTHCYGLVQEISKLEENREAIWEAFYP